MGLAKGALIRNAFWEPGAERLSPKQIEEVQSEGLRGLIRRVYEGSAFYRRLLRDRGIGPDSIRSVEDLEKLPFTTKEDLRDNYPFGLLAVPFSKVVRIHTSSGTTGNPTVVAYSKRDLEVWANCIARCLTMTGVTPEDVFQVILGYGLFTGGLGFHYGAELIGAKVVPSSTGGTKRQIKLMKDFEVTAFTSIPSYALYLGETAIEMGIDPSKDLKVKTISCGAESWSEGTREKLEELFGCMVFNSYGLSEVGGPGVAFECIAQDGLHVWSDHFLVEVIDPRTGESLPPGEEGELVITTLSREAMPLIRYRTRDIAMILDDDICECGRAHRRISWIKGRTDDMIKIRGVNVFPSQIEHVLMRVPGVGNNYQIVVEKRGHMDELKVRIEVTGDIFRGELKDLVELRERIASELENVLGLRLTVELAEPGSLPRAEGKAVRVLDRRPAG
ncbi:MAG: phenylacetate--CoA ligase [Candidatus Bathyarchaeia archaeon]